MAESTLVRLYKRGEEYIDLDALLKKIKAEKDNWLTEYKMSDNVRESLSKMIEALDANDGSLVYTPGGGFDNTLGFTKDSQADRYAAGFLGNLIRDMLIYKEPSKEEEKPVETPEEVPAVEEIEETPTEKPTEKPTIYLDETDYLNANHPRATKVPNFLRRLNSYSAYSQEDKIKLSKALQSLTNENLFKLIAIGMNLNPSDKQLNKSKTITEFFNGVPDFLNNFILKMALEIGRIKGLYHQFGENDNRFYIPFNSPNLTDIGAVYEISPTGEHKFYYMDKRDIPYFIKTWHNDFITLLPTHKNGGTIRKFDTGGKPLANITLSDSYNWRNNIFSKFQLNLIDLLEKIYTDSTLTDELKRLKYQEITNSWNTMQERHYKIMGDWDKTSSVRPEDNSVFNYQTDIAKNYSFVNDAIGNSATDFKKKNNQTLKLDSVGKWNPDNRGEGFTYARTLLGTTDTLKDDDQFWESLNKYGITHNTREGFGNYNFVALQNQADVPTTGDDTDKKDTPTGKKHSDLWIKLFGDTDKPSVGDWVDEDYPDIIPNFLGKGDFWNMMLDTLGIGRPIYSTVTNNRVDKTIDKSLKPLTKIAGEEWSPITGAFDLRLAFYKRAADALSRINYTTDAMTNAAMELERLKYADEQRLQGDLVHDQEIRRTRGIALDKATKSMYNRIDAANFNRASINLTNRERALLEATRLKSNWQTWDNYWAGLESRFRLKMEDRVQSATKFYDNIEAEQAEKLYTDYMRKANADLYAWMNSPEGKGKDITEWPLYPLYSAKQREARMRANMIIYTGVAGRRGIPFDNKYKDTDNLFFNRGWNGAKENF